MRTSNPLALLVAPLALALVIVSPAAAADWGTVKGTITWGGPGAPPKKDIKPDKDQDHCLSKGALPDETWIMDKSTGGVKNVFVWLIDAKDPKAKLPIHPALAALKVKEVVMDQPCCKFEPRCIALREGQTIIGKNSSPINHNMNWTGGAANPGNNKLIPANGSIDIKGLVAATAPIKVACNIHSWMSGWVRVFDHPYYALTDDKGNFEIKNAPAGKYNVVIWHEDAGWVNGGKTGKTITIPANGTVEVNEKAKPAE